MNDQRPAPRDPTIAFALALLFPGLGHLYAGRVAAGISFAVAELLLFRADLIPAVVLLHFFQAIAAAGAAKLGNVRAGLGGDVPIPPPPPRGHRTAHPRAATPSAPPVPPAPPPEAPLVPEAFLEELQNAWREHRAGAITARQFADRKWRAIRRVAPDDRDDAEALVAAARELVGAGVLTSEEVHQLAARVTP